ncbi:TOMM precursor leader peptide-binding protein [Cryptosporangium minutisporangium]|uniref:Bacteriocin biosynthesis cyclodehydratase domain-containing protein n=1 Tax=Cryptosporangium minutisporangium TaxID=113569 RepID=A0ABP6T1B2_9ACTN
MTHSTFPSQPSILVLTGGTFGDRVGSLLRRSRAATVQSVDPHGTHPGFWPHADLVVLATGFERPRLAELVDRMAFHWDRSWFPVFATATTLVSGPVVVPGRTACYQCYTRRRDQHRGADDAGRPDVEFAQPTPHVDIAVALAEQSLDEVLHGGAATVRTFDQVSGGLSRSSVLAVNRCRRCRPKLEDEENSELWQHLAAAAAQPAAAHPVAAHPAATPSEAVLR